MYHMLSQKLCLTTVESKYRHVKPLMRPTLCQLNFHAIRHSTTCHSMQKLCRSSTALMSTLFLAFTGWQSRILLHFAVRQSMNIPYGFCRKSVSVGWGLTGTVAVSGSPPFSSVLFCSYKKVGHVSKAEGFDERSLFPLLDTSLSKRMKK